MTEIVDSLKRFIVVLFTEFLLFIMGMTLIYMLYTKNCNIADIIGIMTLLIFGIGSIGGGYIGVKAFENYQDVKTNGGKNGNNTGNA